MFQCTNRKESPNYSNMPPIGSTQAASLASLYLKVNHPEAIARPWRGKVNAVAPWVITKARFRDWHQMNDCQSHVIWRIQIRYTNMRNSCLRTHLTVIYTRGIRPISLGFLWILAYQRLRNIIKALACKIKNIRSVEALNWSWAGTMNWLSNQ